MKLCPRFLQARSGAIVAYVGWTRLPANVRRESLAHVDGLPLGVELSPIGVSNADEIERAIVLCRLDPFGADRQRGAPNHPRPPL